MAWQDRPYHREENGGIPPVVFSFPKLTPLTTGLLVACAVVFDIVHHPEYQPMNADC